MAATAIVIASVCVIAAAYLFLLSKSKDTKIPEEMGADKNWWDAN